MPQLDANRNWFDRSADHPEQGMTNADMLAVRAVAARRREIIIFRSTGPWSRPYIARGHPTKPFHVKGKSSTWGPHAGLVPRDASLSKAVVQKDIDKGNKLNQEAIDHGYAREIDLILEDSFVTSELSIPRGVDQRRAVQRLIRSTDKRTYFFAVKPGGGQHADSVRLFEGRRDAVTEGWFVYVIDPFEAIEPKALEKLDDAELEKRATGVPDDAKKRVQVMAVPGSHLPITGDYDLFAVCPRWEEWGGEFDKPQDNTLDNQPLDTQIQRLREIEARYHAGEGDVVAAARAQLQRERLEANKQPEDPDRGNLTPRLFSLILDLAEAMGAPYDRSGMRLGQPNAHRMGIVNQRVHHNAEAGRPFAPTPDEGFPLTIFHPGPIVLSPALEARYEFRDATIDSLEDLKGYFHEILNAGYYVPRNPRWEINLTVAAFDYWKKKASQAPTTPR